jgi:DNA-binding transcriptional regulator of glucitol operon
VHRHWYSGKALLLHLAFVTVASLCLLAGWWQVNRARSGNLASYGYAVEWPVFAVVAAYFWWQLIHDRPNREGSDIAQSLQARGPRGEPEGPRRRRDDESPAMRSYNDALSALAAEGRPKTWRNPKGLP